MLTFFIYFLKKSEKHELLFLETIFLVNLTIIIYALVLSKKTEHFLLGFFLSVFITKTMIDFYNKYKEKVKLKNDLFLKVKSQSTIILKSADQNILHSTSQGVSYFWDVFSEQKVSLDNKYSTVIDGKIYFFWVKTNYFIEKYPITIEDKIVMTGLELANFISKGYITFCYRV